MNHLRQNAFHFSTLLLFTGMIIHCWKSPDMLGWLALFSLIILNALLFILSKPVSMISWFATIIGILGIVMSLPALVKTGFGLVHESIGSEVFEVGTLHPVIYFLISILFGIQQILRLIK